MTILSKVLVVTGFLYGIYHVNNLVQEYKEYSADYGFTLGDFGFDQGELANRPQRKKRSPTQKEYSDELQKCSVQGRACFDKGDIKGAISNFERIVEIGQAFPPYEQYGRNALMYVISLYREIQDDDAFAKYAKIFIEMSQNSSPEENEEVSKAISEYSNKLSEVDKDSDAIYLIERAMEKFTFLDKTKVDLLITLGTIHGKGPKVNKKEFKTYKQAFKIAKASRHPISIINCYLSLHEYYAKDNNVEKMKEVVEEMEENLDPKYEVTIYRFLSENAKKYEHYDEYYVLIDKIIDAVKKGAADPVNKENIIITYKLAKAETLIARELPEDAKKIYDEIKQNEYFCFTTKSKSKYLTVDKVTSADGIQTIGVTQKPGTTLPEEDTVLVVEFENSYLVEEKKEVEEIKVEQEEKKEDEKVAQEEKKEEKVEQEEKVEESKEEEKVEEPKEEEKVEEPKEEEKVEEPKEEKVEEPKEEEPVKVEEEKVEEPIKVEEEEKVEEPVKVEEEEKEKVESAKVEDEEESISGAKITEINDDEEKSIQVSEKVVKFVSSVTIVKPFSGTSVTFENDSKELASDKGYLAKISLYNSDQSKLLDSLYQLIPPETPKHQIV
ncbi:hypothetical protein ACTA71_008560 [Dictyostelium dimigraforme]